MEESIYTHEDTVFYAVIKDMVGEEMTSRCQPSKSS
jgi:hypothetical protein